MVCLVDGEPKTLGFIEILNEFIKHRREVITRRTLYDLEKAKNKAHILEGLGIALLNVDDIIALIKKSKNTIEAKSSLISRSWKPGTVN
jgi:DNA gyrase subunit A